MGNVACSTIPLSPTRRNSDRALAELTREQGRPLHRFLLGLLRDRAAADDVLQQVLLKLVENWPSIRLALKTLSQLLEE